MKNPMQKLRRFFVRTRTYKATAAQALTHPSHDEDDGGNRLSGAFLVVLLLHIIAIVGMFAFARIKENRIHNAPPENPTAKTRAKPAPVKTALPKPPVPAAAATIAAATPPQVTPHEPVKAPANGAHTTYIVKEGETLKKIALAYSVSVPDLVSSNKLKNPDDIHAGQALAIPGAKQPLKTAAAPESKPAQTAAQKTAPAPAERKAVKTYVVRKGDTPLQIARENGCSYEDLMKLNNVKDPKKIQQGQVLKLPVKKG
jgi:LysM repeat protein